MTEHGEQTFFAIDDVLGSRETFTGKQCALRAHASGPRINRVLHVGQFARGHCARTKCARRADADGRHHLFWREIQHATSCDRRCERAERRVMPAVFAHAGPADFAKPHFNFVRDDSRKN